jgi:hypothetical protein
MNASAVTRFLQNVPPLYPIVAVQNGNEVLIESLEYSHDPAQVTMKLAAPADSLRPLIVELAKRWPGHAGVDFETTTTEDLIKLIADAVGQPEPEATFVELSAGGVSATIPVMEPATVGPFESTPHGDEPRPFAELMKSAAESPAPGTPYVVHVDHVATGFNLDTGKATEPEVVATHIETYHADGTIEKTAPKRTRKKATPPAAPETT